MPTSRIQHLPYLMDQVLAMKPRSILDAGIGWGRMGVMFREFTDIWAGHYDTWKTRIDGIEIFPDYIGMLQHLIYDNIYIGDALDILPTLQKYDLIYLGDVLEHFNRKDGLILLGHLKAHSKRLIIATPLKVSEQGAVFGNSHETHLSQWSMDDFPGAHMVSYGNTLVISYYNEKQVYYCDGLKFYGEKVPLKRYSNSFAPTLFLGLYFNADYQTFANHVGEKSVFWNGSDVSRLLNSPEWIKIVQNSPAKHFCHNEQLYNELGSIGIDSEITPLFFGYKDKFTINYKLSTTPKVFMCAHPGREAEYGVDIALQLAQEFKDIEFHIYGVTGTTSDNVIYHGQVPEEAMDSQMSNYQACLRMNLHDGMSQIICKGKLMGIHPIITRDIETLRKELKNIKNKKAPWTGDMSEIKDLNWIENMVAA